jgi:hypothetical protein
MRIGKAYSPISAAISVVALVLLRQDDTADGERDQHGPPAARYQSTDQRSWSGTIGAKCAETPEETGVGPWRL